jgi:NitT/TauT family transport system substrate-binding protein
MMAASVGLDRKDIDWVNDPALRPLDLFTDGKFLGFPPEPQEIRARHATGHVIVNTALDRPWSQYFCCMLGGNREYVRNHPVVTKRAVRAILKATDLCDSEPQRVAQDIADPERKSLQMARIRCRRHCQVLRTAAAGSGPHQV